MSKLNISRRDFLKAAGSDNVMLISDRGLEAIGVVDKVREIIKGANLMRISVPSWPLHPVTMIFIPMCLSSQ